MLQVFALGWMLLLSTANVIFGLASWWFDRGDWRHCIELSPLLRVDVVTNLDDDMLAVSYALNVKFNELRFVSSHQISIFNEQ